MIFNKLHIKNFKGIDDLTITNLGKINLIVGKNNGGKSTILDALFLVAKNGDPRSIEDIYTVRSAKINKGDDLRFLFPKSNLTVYPTIEGFDEKSNTYVVLQSYNGDIKDGNIIAESGVDLPIDGVRIVCDKIYNGEKYAAKPHIYSLMVKRKTEDIIDYRYAKNIKSIPIFYVPSSSSFNHITELAKNSILNHKKQIQVLDAIKEVEPHIRDYHAIGDDIHFILTNWETTVNLQSMGEGFSKVFGIILAIINSSNGICLIDEIENGLHHSVLKNTWKHILLISERFNVQLFITTHNAEIMTAITEVAQTKHQNTINTIRLLNKSGKGHIALCYNFSEMKSMLNSTNEIRGW